MVLGTRSLTDAFTIGLATVTGLVLWKYQKLPEPYVILVAALVGLVAREFMVA